MAVCLLIENIICEFKYLDFLGSFNQSKAARSIRMVEYRALRKYGKKKVSGYRASFHRLGLSYLSLRALSKVCLSYRLPDGAYIHNEAFAGGGGQSDLSAEFIVLAGLALADPTELLLIYKIDLYAVSWDLMEQTTHQYEGIPHYF